MKHYVFTKVAKRLYLVFLILFFIRCKQGVMSKEDLGQSPIQNITLNEKEDNHGDNKNLKTIKSARAKYKVKNVKVATRQIKVLAKKYEGYISDLEFQNNLRSIENRFTIKIPKESFDIFLDSIHNYVDFIDFENINTKDVTEEFFDAESRLKTKIEVKKRYEVILRKRSKTVDDILNTEEKLRVIQEEIDATKGRLKYFKNRISYSTINIELYQVVDFKPKPIAYQKTFLDKIKEGFKNGSSIISNIIIGLINIWPILILGIGILLVYKKRKK